MSAGGGAAEAGADAANTLKILLATDCHLGYAEKDQVRAVRAATPLRPGMTGARRLQVRGEDSITTFEEMLQMAKDQKVRMHLPGPRIPPRRRASASMLRFGRRRSVGVPRAAADKHAPAPIPAVQTHCRRRPCPRPRPPAPPHTPPLAVGIPVRAFDAPRRQADMVLLGGDLFHDNKPSRQTVVKTMRLLRKCAPSSRRPPPSPPADATRAQVLHGG